VTAAGQNWGFGPTHLSAGTYYIDFVASNLTASNVTTR
jgi:hypothetical protein